MKEILEVITALNQAANNAMWKKTDALEREKFKGPRDFKVNDSFKLKFADNKMMVEYTLEVKNALMPNIKFEVNPDNKITSILKYLKDEYKQITGKSISFEEESKLNIVVTPISNVTQINRYSKSFTIKDTESYKDSYNKEVEKHHKEQIKKIDTLEEQLNKKVIKERKINEAFIAPGSETEGDLERSGPDIPVISMGPNDRISKSKAYNDIITAAREKGMDPIDFAMDYINYYKKYLNDPKVSSSAKEIIEIYSEFIEAHKQQQQMGDNKFYGRTKDNFLPKKPHTVNPHGPQNYGKK